MSVALASLALAVHFVSVAVEAEDGERCLAILEQGAVVDSPASGKRIDSAVQSRWCWSADSPPARREATDLLAGESIERATESIVVQLVPPVEGLCAKLEVIAAPTEMWREVPEGLLPRWPAGEGCSVELVRARGEAWRVRAVGPKAGSWWVDLAARSSRARLETAPAEPLRFVAVDREGSPVKDPRLELLALGGRGQPRNLARFSGTAGAIEVAALPSAERIVALFRAPGFAAQRFEGLPAALPKRITLEPSATVIGRLADQDDMPIEGAQVVVEAWLDEAATILARRQAASGADGRWTIDDLPRGEAVVVATAPRFATSKQIVDLDARRTDLGTIVLHPGATRHVVVVDPEALPIEGARVEPTGLRATLTDGAGQAELAGLPRSQAVEVKVDAAGFEARTLMVEIGPAEPLTVILERAFVIVGRFASARGDAAPHSRVELLHGNTSLYQTLEPSGDFELELPPETAIEARFSSPTTRRLVHHIEPGSGGEIRDLGELRAPAGRSASGRVLDASDASPVLAARVWLPRPSSDDPLSAWFHGDVVETTTDAEGRFRLGGLDASASEVQVEARNLAVGRFRVPPAADGEDSTELGDLSLEGGATVEAQVEGEVSSRALARLDLTGRWLEPDMLTTPVHEGSARFEHVPQGRATLTVVDGRRLVCEETVEIEDGSDSVVVRCRKSTMTVSGSVEVAGLRDGPGRLIWLPEAPVSPSLISRRASPLGLETSQAFGGGRPQVDVNVTADGYFTTGELRSGRWEVVWRPESGGSSQPIVVELPRLAQVEVPLTFLGHAIAGRVIDLEGTAVEGARVRELGSGTLVWSGRDGGFRFVGIADGTYFVRADARGEESATVQLELAAGEAAEPVELVLGTRDREETLRILTVDGDELPVAGAFVFLDTGQGLRILTADGAGRAAARLDPPFPNRVRLAGWTHGQWYLGTHLPYPEVLEVQQILALLPGGRLVVHSEDVSRAVQIAAPGGWDLSNLMARLGQPPVAAPGLPLIVEGLPPGYYEVTADGRRWQRTVELGRETALDLEREQP